MKNKHYQKAKQKQAKEEKQLWREEGSDAFFEIAKNQQEENGEMAKKTMHFEKMLESDSEAEILAGIKGLANLKEYKILAKFASKCDNNQTKIAMNAVKRIKNIEDLEPILVFGKNQKVVEYCLNKLTEKMHLEKIALLVARYHFNEGIALDAVDLIKKDSNLEQIAMASINPKIGLKALEKIENNEENQKIFSEIAVMAICEEMALRAVEKISNEEILANVANGTPYELVGVKAINKISTPNLLQLVVATAENKILRKRALDKLSGEKKGIANKSKEVNAEFSIES